MSNKYKVKFAPSAEADIDDAFQYIDVEKLVTVMHVVHSTSDYERNL